MRAGRLLRLERKLADRGYGRNDPLPERRDHLEPGRAWVPGQEVNGDEAQEDEEDQAGFRAG